MSYIDDISVIWDMVKKSFNEEEKLPQSVIDLWFGDLKIISFDNNEITFSTDSGFKYNTISENYLGKIGEKFSRLFGFEVKANIVFDGIPADTEKIKQQFMGNIQKENAEENANKNKKLIDSQNYNFEYTFDSFIVGNSNKFAHAACVAVAERPAMDYNPLFIYGPSGLGKTHLMSAVVNEIRRKKKDLRVVYIKGDEFTNQLIESLSKQEMNKFRDRYRN